MKQSKKLLSIFLAMLMLIGTVSVVGNAAIAREDVHYDSMDNAALTPEQVANIILDSLDRDVMPGIGVIEIPVLGELDLSSIDNAFSSIVEFLGKTILGIAGGDAKILINHRTDLCKDGNKKTPYQRSHGANKYFIIFYKQNIHFSTN